MAMLEVNNLSIQFGGLHAVDNSKKASFTA